MDNCQIATLAAGVAGLKDLAALLTEIHTDPFPAPFQNYTESSATDLAGAPVQSGLPRCWWRWEWLPIADYAMLKRYLGVVYIRTPTDEDDGSGNFLYRVYQATMFEEKPPEPISGDMVGPVEFAFVNLEAQ